MVGLAASVSVWSVGSALEKNYSDDNRSGQSAPQTSNALAGENGARADSDAARQAQGGSSESNNYLNNYDRDSSNPNRSSQKSVGSILGNAVTRVNAAAPTQASLQAEIDAGGVASGTTARISGGAKVTVGDAIFVTSDAGLKYLQFAGALAGGYVGAGAGISVSTLANNSTAQAGGILNAGNGGVNVRAINNENAQGTGVAGVIGFVSIGAAVVILNDASVAQSAISDNAVVTTSGAVTISTIDNRTMNTNTYSVGVGALQIGASFSRINLKNDSAVETQAVIGNGATVSANSVTLSSTPVYTATADTIGVSAGIIAGTVNFAYVDAQPESKAMIGNSNITAAGEVAITSSAKYDLTAKGTGVAVGVGALGLMYADVNLGRGNGVDEVTAGVGAANIVSSKLNIRANSDDKLFAKSVAGSAALISVTGALAFTNSDLATRAMIGNNAIINTGTFGLYTTHIADIDAVSDAITVAAGSGQAGLTRNVNTGSANASIGNNAIVNAVELYGNATNELVKNKADTTKPVGQQYRNNIDAQSFKIVGLDILSSDSDLGTVANPLAANVSFGPGSRVTAASLPARKSVFDISTSTKLTAHDYVNIESISLLGSISAGFSIIDAVTQSKIIVDGATLINDDGAVSLSTRSTADNVPDAKLLVISGLVGVAAAKVRADTTATSQVDVNNATIRGQSVAIMAGKYNSASAVGINLLDNHAWSTIRTASLVPSGAFDSVQSTLRENNLVNITGNSKVLAIGDVDLVARNGFSTSKVDKQVTNISIIPSFSSDSIDGALFQTNTVNIANSAKVEAGLGSNVTYKIEPLTFNGTRPTIGGVLAPTPDRVGQPLTAAEKQARALPVDVDFVFAPLSAGSISMPILNGYVFRLMSGAAGSGTIGGHYQYTGADTSIVPHTTLYGDASRWRQLTQAEINALPGSDLVVYDSNITLNFALGLANKFYIVKPADASQPILSLRNVGTMLIKQYEDLVSWMGSHTGNSEAIARYQAQLLTVEAQLNDLGLLAPDKVNGRQIVNKGLDVLFIDVPSLTASPGSIYIEQTGAAPSAFSGQLSGGQLRAHADAKVDIVNSTPFTMTTNGVKMLDGRRVVAVDGKYLTLQPGNVYVNFAPLTNVNVNTAKTVRIIQEGLIPTSGYDLSGLPPVPSSLSQDLYINNGVDNADGPIEIRNASGSIYVSGDVRGSTVVINAKNNLSVNSDGWYRLADPRQYLDFFALDNDARGAGPDLRTFDNANNVTDGTRTLAQSIAGNQSRVVAQGRLSLTARYLNLNGLVQSGVDTIDLAITNAFVPPSGFTTFSALADQYANFNPQGYENAEPRLPTAIPGVTFGSQDVPFDVTWDPQQKSFNLGKLQSGGGEIIIAGQIVSTGGGKLKVASGYASVNIQNDTPYKVVLDEIDTTKNRTGKITVIDTDRIVGGVKRPLQTIYTINATGIQEAVAVGTLNNGRITYDTPTITQYADNAVVNFLPEPGLQYVWVEGQTLSQITRETFQKKSFNLTGGIFEGLDDALAADSTLINTEILARGEPKILLESETRERQGTTGVPSYANNQAYTLSYVQKVDTVIVARNNMTLVRNPPAQSTATVYKYVGPDNTTLDMATTNFADTNLWVNSGQSAASFVPSPPDHRFESDNRNIVYDPPEVHGGGWLSEKTITTRRTINTGLKDFFTHTLKADYPVRIEISRGVAQPNVTIASAGGIKMAGNIQVPATGNATLTSSAGSIDSVDSVAIYANSPTLVASGFIDVQIEGNRGPVNALAGGDIDLTAISKDNLTSRIDVGAIVSTGGNVEIIAADGIRNANASSIVAGNVWNYSRRPRSLVHPVRR